MINQFEPYYLHSNLSNINAFIASRADVLLACHAILCQAPKNINFAWEANAFTAKIMVKMYNKMSDLFLYGCKLICANFLC